MIYSAVIYIETILLFSVAKEIDKVLKTIWDTWGTTHINFRKFSVNCLEEGRSFSAKLQKQLLAVILQKKDSPGSSVYIL